MSRRQFLFNGVQPGGNTFKPRLYCNDDYFIRKSAQDQALQQDGQPATDVNGHPVTIDDLYGPQIIATTRNSVLPHIFQFHGPAAGNEPAMTNYYFFEASHSDKLCVGDFLAQTLVAETPHSPVPVVVFCPLGFTFGRTENLGGILPQPPTRRGYGNQALYDIEPRSLTFLHEMFHLCPWDPMARRNYITDVIAPNIDPCRF